MSQTVTPWFRSLPKLSLTLHLLIAVTLLRRQQQHHNINSLHQSGLDARRRPDVDLISERRARRPDVISRHTVLQQQQQQGVMLRRQTNSSSGCGYCTRVTAVRLTLRSIAVKSSYVFSYIRYYLSAIIARLLISIRPIQSQSEARLIAYKWWIAARYNRSILLIRPHQESSDNVDSWCSNWIGLY